MANVFTLDPAIIGIAQGAIDDLLDQLGKDCQLVFPGPVEDCVNCVYDVIGKKSSNRWKTGGPMPFPNGNTCPFCNGVGTRTGETYKSIKLLINWNPATWWVQTPPNVQVPAGSIQTKGYMTSLPDVLQAREMIAEIKIEGLRKYRFKLNGEPVDNGNIIQGRYFIANWIRAGG